MTSTLEATVRRNLIFAMGIEFSYTLFPIFESNSLHKIRTKSVSFCHLITVTMNFMTSEIGISQSGIKGLTLILISTACKSCKNKSCFHEGIDMTVS